MKWATAFMAFSFLAQSCTRSNTDPSTNNQQQGCKSASGVKDIDGNSYSSVTIGAQEWMTENLKVTNYRNGDAIPNVSNSALWGILTTGAWCYYNNDPQFNNPYGKLYNWYAVNDPRGLAPAGWHIPSDAEWTVLVNYLGGSSAAGAKLKESGSIHWQQPDSSSNSSCFTALPGGNCNPSSFIYINYYGFWWSSSDAGSAGAWFFDINHNNSFTDRGTGPKTDGYSIRCIKN